MILKERLIDTWKRELPSQFQDKINISAFIESIGAELTKLEDVYEGVRDDTDIKTATGKQLDYIGDIVGITRNDAYSLLEITDIGYLTDEMYRSVLYFQILKNNADGTYENIMKGLHLLWGESAIIRYYENPLVELYNGAVWNKPDPASISIVIEDIQSDDPDPNVIKPMVIRPGGVKMAYKVSYRDQIAIGDWEHFTNLQISYDVFAHYNGDHQYDGQIQYQKIRSGPYGYVQYNGAIQYDGQYPYDALGKHYAVWDGTYKFNGEIQWRSLDGEEAPGEVDAVILNQAKLKQIKMRANGGDWKIAYFVFGNGLNKSGNRYTPTGAEDSLLSEVYRSPVAAVEQTDEITWTYTGEIPSDACNGEYISEIGLADQDGELICIKTFDKKLKASGSPMVFKIDDRVDLVY